MPQLNEILDNRGKKFIKRSYRSWDLSGNFDSNKNEILSQEIPYNISTSTKTEHKPNTKNIYNSIDAIKNEIFIKKTNDTITHNEEKYPQTEHKQHTKNITNQTQEISKKKQTEHKLNTEQNTEKLKNKTQKAHKVDTNISFAALSGIQRDIIILIFNHCKIAKQDSTNEISISYISTSLNIRIGSIKNSISRLEQKKFVTRLEYKIGRGGWSRYKLSDSLYSELLYLEKTHKLDTKYTQIEHKPDTEQHTEQHTMPASSSSLINKTTTETNNKNELPDEWLNTDIELLDIINFHKGHLIQLFRHGLDLDVVQQSINHYAFDLIENEKAKQIKTDPLSFFMGIMKRSGYYAAPENYESPKDRGRRLFLEQEAAKIKKRAEEEKNLMNVYFEVWSNTLTHQEKIELVGKDELGPNRAILTINDKLKNYYKNNFWKEQYYKIMNHEAD